MIRSRRSLCTLLIMTSSILWLSGCYPKRIVWTPDGRWAAVSTDNGLFFIDPNGKIVDTLPGRVLHARWSPDGRHLAIERHLYAQQWKDVETSLPKPCRDELVQYAQPLLTVKNKDEWQTRITMLRNIDKISKNHIHGIKLYLRDNAPEDFPKDLIASWKDDCDFNCYSLQLGVWKHQTFTLQKTLFSSAQRIWDMTFSRKGQVLAFTTAILEEEDDDDIHHPSSLWAVDIKTEELILLDRNIALYPDWGPQGSFLYYTRSVEETPDDHTISTILKIRVCDPNGALYNSDQEKPTAIVGLLANDFTRVHCLSDGRILFSSIEVTLPAISKDVPDYTQLFLFDPQRPTTLTRLIPRGVLPQTHDYDLDFFEVSPDEHFISFPEGHGRVAVLSIQTGEFKILQHADLNTLITVPVWRAPSDLCYIDQCVSKDEPASKDSLKQVVLQEVKANAWQTPRSISTHWPLHVKKDWLE